MQKYFFSAMPSGLLAVPLDTCDVVRNILFDMVTLNASSGSNKDVEKHAARALSTGAQVIYG
jgi:hypothetical protein